MLTQLGALSTTINKLQEQQHKGAHNHGINIGQSSRGCLSISNARPFKRSTQVKQCGNEVAAGQCPGQCIRLQEPTSPESCESTAHAPCPLSGPAHPFWAPKPCQSSMALGLESCWQQKHSSWQLSTAMQQSAVMVYVVSPSSRFCEAARL